MSAITDSKLSDFCSQFAPTSIAGLEPLKDAASTFLANEEFPTTRKERFKYTRLQKLQNATFNAFEALSFEQLCAYQILHDTPTIFVNGPQLFIPEQLSSSISVVSLENSNIEIKSVAHKDVFGAMNCLYANNGLSISFNDNAVLEGPIQIIYVHSGGQYFYRNLLKFGKNAEAQIVLAHFSTANSIGFSHTHTQIEVAQDARIKLHKIQSCEQGHFDFNEERIYQGKQSNFEINTISLNSSFVRNDLHVEVQGEHAETKLNGAYLLKAQQHVANYTTIDHQVPNCESFETYKGIIDEQAIAVFNGKVFVRKDAQKTNAFQSNANILLSDSASINSKPELEIYADDVKCSHGSTTGQLDDNALFYLKARGLSDKAAKSLLLQAFMDDVLNVFQPEELSAFIFKALAARFNWQIED
ncbi:MAG: Fe-S cluster assembly protein SufD [Flavobacteriales bacterium]